MRGKLRLGENDRVISESFRVKPTFLVGSQIQLGYNLWWWTHVCFPLFCLNRTLWSDQFTIQINLILYNIKPQLTITYTLARFGSSFCVCVYVSSPFFFPAAAHSFREQRLLFMWTVAGNCWLSVFLLVLWVPWTVYGTHESHFSAIFY